MLGATSAAGNAWSHISSLPAAAGRGQAGCFEPRSAAHPLLLVTARGSPGGHIFSMPLATRRRPR